MLVTPASGYAQGIAGPVELVALDTARDESVTSRLYVGAIAGTPDEAADIEGFAEAYNLDLIVVTANEQEEDNSSLAALMAQLLLREQSRSLSGLSQTVALESELERCERRFTEIEHFHRVAAVGETSITFNNVTPKGQDVTLSQKGISLGGDQISDERSFSLKMPVPLSHISSISFGRLGGSLDAGRLVCTLERIATGETLARWSLGARDLQNNPPLYLPVSVSAEDVSVRLRLDATSMGEGEEVRLGLAGKQADPDSHLIAGESDSIEAPLQLKIYKALPHLRATPFAGCIYPENISRDGIVHVERDFLYGATRLLPETEPEFDLVTQRKYIHEGLLVHPNGQGVTCAHLDLDYKGGEYQEVRVRAVNDNEKSDGILFGVIASQEPLTESDVQRRLELVDWVRVDPLAAALRLVKPKQRTKHLYFLTRPPEGASHNYGWLLVTDVSMMPRLALDAIKPE